MELLASFNDPTYLPGRTPLFETWGVGVSSWGERARELADLYCGAFEHQTMTRVDGPNELHGWITAQGANGEPPTLHVVTHPLWKLNASGSDQISAAVLSWAGSIGVNALRPIDSFNLSRRITWVRGNLSYFPIIQMNLGSPVQNNGTTNNWIQKVIALDIGMKLERQERRWVRIAPTSAWAAKDGVWLAQMGTTAAFEITIRDIPGAGVKIRPVGNGQPHLTRDQWNDLKVIACREEINRGDSNCQE